MSVYVETWIRGSIEELWEKTQSPDLHERWDLRFSRIEYLPRSDEASPQDFLYETGRPRRFDAYMIFSERRGCVVDYLGTHQHLAVDIDLSVDEEGGLRFRSGAQRFHEGPISFSFPMLFSGYAEVREWYDDGTGRFRIDVSVSNPTFGSLFGYRGSFDVEWVESKKVAVPDHLKPSRTERRE